ncbi:uncharacterized protein ARMOST_22115 [Armillaria ostoyae]|uniref:Uncharacterized protein n=1 Tax=Armillaria ostoyae TaxID=47428 RepID=A0A284SBY5_ARMOS|nr:uncharacterized protein ARMOST_22115 [Armillaria ostoyae]
MSSPSMPQHSPPGFASITTVPNLNKHQLRAVLRAKCNSNSTDMRYVVDFWLYLVSDATPHIRTGPKPRRIEPKKHNSPQRAESMNPPKPLCHHSVHHEIRPISSKMREEFVRHVLWRFEAVLAEERLIFYQEVGRNAGSREDD